MADRSDGALRRRYWAEQMDAAHAFMLAVAAQPVADTLEPVVQLPDAARSTGVDLAFSSKPHAHGGPRLYLLRASLVDDLLAVAETLASRGWQLVVEDGYRTVEMQRLLAQSDAVFDRVVDRTMWELDGEEPDADLLARRLGALVAASPSVGTHMSASAVDVTVVDRRTGVELDRCGPYLEISEATPMDSPFVGQEQRRVRMTVTEAMAERGFVAYPFEFWHFNRGDAYEAVMRGDPSLARFGPVDVDVETGGVIPLVDPHAPLTDPEAMARLLAAALRRRQGSLSAGSASQDQ